MHRKRTFLGIFGLILGLLSCEKGANLGATTSLESTLKAFNEEICDRYELVSLASGERCKGNIHHIYLEYETYLPLSKEQALYFMEHIVNDLLQSVKLSMRLEDEEVNCSIEIACKEKTLYNNRSEVALIRSYQGKSYLYWYDPKKRELVPL